MAYRTEVTRVESDSLVGAWNITVTRASVPSPRLALASDLPVDIRSALLDWLKGVESGDTGTTKL
jgi:hypothetical protein